MDRRIAISGLTPARPFRIDERVLRLTSSASAAFVTVTPSGSKQRALMISPGWGGLCMRIATTSLVIIQEHHIIYLSDRSVPGVPPSEIRCAPAAGPWKRVRSESRAALRHSVRFFEGARGTRPAIQETLRSARQTAAPSPDGAGWQALEILRSC